MSNPVSPLGGVSFDGFARVEEIGPLGMITLRAKAGTKGLEAAVKAATGCALPDARQITRKGDNKAVGWMSPDEYLILCPRAGVADALAALAKGLAGQHHLAVDVSDARAVFRVTGEKADQVLRKLSPVDFDKLGPSEIRRSRMAQVAAAFWAEDGGFTVVTFRSVADYAFKLLATSAQRGSELE